MAIANAGVSEKVYLLNETLENIFKFILHETIACYGKYPPYIVSKIKVQKNNDVHKCCQKSKSAVKPFKLPSL